MKIFWK